MQLLKRAAWPLGIAAAILLAYYIVNAAGLFSILAKLNEPNIGLPLIFLIGVLASFHCVGMCGGLVVAIGVKRKTACPSPEPGWKSQLKYNTARLFSYTAIGAVLGGFGSFFGINPAFGGFVLIAAAAFMVIFGLSLITEFRWLKAVQLRTPLFIARRLYGNAESRKPKGPVIIGLLNGFMPCGPLQAMQLYALTSGSLLAGAASMGAYALGTIPLLFGLGHAVNRLSGLNIVKMMKYSGAIVIMLGLGMLYRGLANFGFNARAYLPGTEIVDDRNEKFQEIRMNVSSFGYQPNVLYAKKGVPVRWIINGSGMSGCTNEIILHGYDIRQKLNRGDTIIEFTPREAGEIRFSCWMQMVWGKFIVTNDGQASLPAVPTGVLLNQAAALSCQMGNGAGCGTGGCGCGCGGD